MDTIKINRITTKMIAHRGLSGLETENSIPAFVAAGNRSYYGVETDVHVTKDGRFVIIHDNLTGRVSSDCIDVEASSYGLVRKIALKDLCPAAGITGEMTRDNLPEAVCARQDLLIPNLTEYIRICKKYEKKCILELKNEFDPKDMERMIEEICELDYLKEMIFISFSLENMKNLRNLLPNQELYYLTCGYNEEIHEALKRYQLHLDICHTALTEEIIQKLHSEGILINCWTCDDREDAERLAAWGVDFITSNILE